MKVLIVGAGIIGACLAYRLSLAGANVTVIETAAPAQAATGRSFGWINASFYANAAHHRLRVQAIAAHHRLQAELPQIATRWQGTLWWEDQAAGFDQMLGDLAVLGYPVAPILQADITALEPALLSPPGRALRFPSEGATDAAAMTHVVLAASGAKVLSGLAAKNMITREGRFFGVDTVAGPILADHTIVAAGVGTQGLLAEFDLKLRPRPGLLMRTNPVRFRLNHILVTPEQEIRQTPDGCLLAPCAANHQADTAETIPDAAAARGATLAHLRALFGPDITEAETLLGHRPYPSDGLPVLGRVADGLSIAVMHSGVTLAPLAAEALTAEIIGQGADLIWSDFHPQRLLTRR